MVSRFYPPPTEDGVSGISFRLIQLFLVLFFAGMILKLIGSARQPPFYEHNARGCCHSNIGQLLLAAQAYADDHKGEWPPTLEDLYPDYTVRELMSCPSAIQNGLDPTYVYRRELKRILDRPGSHRPTVADDREGVNVGQMVDGSPRVYFLAREELMEVLRLTGDEKRAADAEGSVPEKVAPAERARDAD